MTYDCLLEREAWLRRGGGGHTMGGGGGPATRRRGTMYVCVCVCLHMHIYMKEKCCATKHTPNVAVLAILTSAREELHVGFEQSGCARTAHDHAILVQVVQTCMLGHQMFGSVPPFG